MNLNSVTPINSHSTNQREGPASPEAALPKSISSITSVTKSICSTGKSTAIKTLNAIKGNGYVVAQCGPQITLPCLNEQSTLDINLKGTAVCTSDSCHIFPFHFEIGTPAPSVKDFLTSYNLWVKQVGWEIQRNGHFNPLKFSYKLKLETLEHTEVVKKYVEFEYPLHGTVQGLIGFEVGETITEKDFLSLCYDIFCRTPAATGHAMWELFHHKVVERFFPQTESEPVTKSQPASLNRQVANCEGEGRTAKNSLANRFANVLCITAKKALLTPRPDKTIWFNIIFGPSEINSGIGIGVPNHLEASWLFTLYPRLKVTFEYKNGEFIPPKCIRDILKCFHKHEDSWDKVSALFNKTRELAKAECAEEPSAIVVIDEVLDYLARSLQESRINDIPRKEFLAVLASATQCRFVVNNQKGEFDYGFDTQGKRFTKEQLEDKKHRTFTINNHEPNHGIEGDKKEKNKDENQNDVHLENYKILTRVMRNEDHRKNLITEILEHFPEAPQKLNHSTPPQATTKPKEA